MSEPLISVVVATYKQEERLACALESLAQQTYKNFEIILVDDNDDQRRNEQVKTIVSKFTKHYPSVVVKLFENHPNQGSAKTRNIGINHSSGSYITFLDDDDTYLPNKLERQIETMLIENADYSITDIFLYNDEGKLIDKRIRKYIKKKDPESLMEYHMRYHMTGTDSMMFRTGYLHQIGGFSEIDLGDEFYLMHKAIKAEGVFSYVPACDILAYVHVGEVGLSSGTNKILCEEKLYEFKAKYFNNLTKETCRYIKMRHHAVLAFAWLRMSKFLVALKHGALSFFASPLECVKLLISRKF